MKKLLSLVSIIALILVSSCENENKEDREGKLKITVELYNGTERVYVGDTASLAEEYDFHLTLFRLYLAEIYANNSSGTESLVSTIELVDPAANSSNSFSSMLVAGDYSGLDLGFGVDAEQNDMDPGSFDNNHPLSSYQSMYWSMLKYRFAKFEGKAKSRTTGQDNIFVTYHPGTDDLYQKRNFDINFNISEGGTTELLIKMDINEILDGPGGKIDFATESDTHSTPTDIHIARKFMENVAAAAKLSVVSS